jgi:hypothetical protein
MSRRDPDPVPHRIGTGGIPGGPVTTKTPAERSMWQAKHSADVKRAARDKARREVEAEEWMTEVRKRKAP